MENRRSRQVRAAVVACAIAVAGARAAQAQPLGTFRWQQQPYCNVLQVQVVQNGTAYTLNGTDDACGASRQLAVSGVAFPNPDGSIGMGLVIVTATGSPLHLDATLTLPSASGTWRDSTGQTGAWVLTPGPAVPGGTRPAPRLAFPSGLTAGGAAIGNVGDPVAATDAATKAYTDASSAGDQTYALGLASRALHLSAFTARTHVGVVTHDDQGCIVFDQAAGSTIRLDIPLPLGAVVSALTFNYKDSSTSAFQVQIRAVDHVDGGTSTMSGVGTLNSSNGASGIRVETLALSLPAVTATRNYYISVPAPAHTGTLAFCGVRATFTIP